MGEFAGGFANKVSAKQAGNVGNENGQDYDLFNDPKKSKGQKIMEMAEIILPAIKDWLKEAHDENGMLVHQSKMRAIALHAAQAMIEPPKENYA